MTGPSLDPAVGLVLLPEFPESFEIRGSAPQWRQTLLGLGLVETTDRPDLVVHAGAGSASASLGAPLMIGWGRRAPRADAAGTHRALAEYRASRVGPDVVVAVPKGAGATGGLVTRLRRLRGSTWWVVEGSGGRAAPCVLAAAGIGGVVESIRVESDPRRRVALTVAPDPGGRRSLIKVTRQPGGSDRATGEQGTLAKLHQSGLGDHVPFGLGSGRLGPLAWSAETAVAGVPLDLHLARTDRAAGLALLRDLSSWLGDLAAATRTAQHPTSAPDWSDSVRLRAEHLPFEPWLADLGEIDSVLAHGDLATGGNVLVDAGSWSVIDWETAVEAALPLLDLLPLLCLGIARLRGHSSTSDEAGRVSLDLCRGTDPDSPWLFERVAEYLDRISVGVDSAGQLAGLAWGHLASMRHVHAELLEAAGQKPVHWTTGADLVAARWIDDPSLGADWRAFAEHVDVVGRR